MCNRAGSKKALAAAKNGAKIVDEEWLQAKQSGRRVKGRLMRLLQAKLAATPSVASSGGVMTANAAKNTTGSGK